MKLAIAALMGVSRPTALRCAICSAIIPGCRAMIGYGCHEGNVASLAAPFEPLVKDIVFTRVPVGDSMNPAFRQRCIGTYSHGATTVCVGQDSDEQLTLTVGSQPIHKLRPYQSRTFVIDELEGYRIEFHLGSDGNVDELFLHQPNGTFAARRAQVVASR